MVNKYTIPLIGVGLLLLVGASKQIGGFFGQVGTATGGAIQMGLANFVSALTFGAVGAPKPDMGSSMTDMTKMMMMPMGGGGTIIPPDPSFGQGKPIVDSMGNTVDLTGGIKPFDIYESIKNFVLGGEKPTDIPIDPRTGAIGLNQNVVMNFIEMLTGTIKGSSSDVTLTSSSLNDIFKGAYDYLAKGSSDLGGFLKTYKFPSGETLSDVIGGGKGLTPDAFGMMSKSDMLLAMGLNMDKKIDTPSGVISYGGNPNSIGLGKGGILPAHNLTQILQQNPSLTASQAADLLAREMMSYGMFDFGSNTGAGNISVFDKMGMVVKTNVNPVLLKYEAYKAMYGIM